ncbi:Mur ligase family protein [Aliiglaciecola lipolytica]|uniref:Mur ligase family protein n=1 Tax=Aliiglaciecola lipolytica E3 TaxID=1127673 RepID=K6YYH2_9ALTE|nr:Mur ligase family protein [Aliiglaciecola lipolytica]GAC16270.1 mur ligase family protein [Aliiglaciecola lipolytica E3]
MRLELDEVRRLTGPNLLWDKPGAILDVFIDDVDPRSVVTVWQSWVDKLLQTMQWPQSCTYRLYSGGASMALSAEMDALYTACDVAEFAWELSVAQMNGLPEVDWQLKAKQLQVALSEEQNPELLKILQQAEAHQVTAISDDDELSLGMGASVRVWPIDQLPDLTELNWNAFRDIPRAFITGTNGKSTSVRLASEIAKAAGINAGVTSTDFIKVGEQIIDKGDYSGPGGARMLLRDKRTEMAFLEVARGGILRRGIPVDNVNAALITNVASDHLGQYGINTVEELAKVKFVVAKGLTPAGTLVLNADNALVVEQAKELDCRICWFSEDENHPLIKSNQQSALPCVFVQNKQFVYASGDTEKQYIVDVADVPMTMKGAARHNIQNALGVIGLCMALKLPVDAIKRGLLNFGSSAKDNPGRGNLYAFNGATVMLDFAHNAHSVAAMINTAKQLPANRYIVMFSNAGDRSDADIQQLTDEVRKLDADHYIIAELERYLRGRQVYELPKMVSAYLQRQGVEAALVECVDSPLSGAKLALSLCRPGDVLVLFCLDQREEIHQLLITNQD